MKQICNECVMSFPEDPNVTFDGNGVCNYCTIFKEKPEIFGKHTPEKASELWNKKLYEIKSLRENTQNWKYDCLIGASGGLDSSYLCYIARKHDLKALLVNVDNSFNSDTANRNLKIIKDKTGFDWYSPSMSFDEFRELQLAFLRASVIDTDLPSDYLIEAFIHILARKHKIKYIFSGGNYFADAFMPTAWNYPNKTDYTNIMNVYKKFGNSAKLKTLPKYGAFQVLQDKYLHKIKYVTPLNLVCYNRFEALKTLQKEWKYEAYDDKHGENIFTRFYQRYILPVKFGVDKRIANYSNYIRSNGMTRNEALRLLRKSAYDYPVFENDKKFILEKLGLSGKEFVDIMALPVRSHKESGSDDWLYKLEKKVRKTVKFIIRRT